MDPVGNFGAPQARVLLVLAALQSAQGTQAPHRQSRLTKAKIIPGQEKQSYWPLVSVPPTTTICA